MPMDVIYKRAIYALAVVFIAFSVLYLEDPWLWRRYGGLFTSMVGIDLDLEPTETVRGDGSFEIPVAREGELTISPDALKAAEDYAAEFDSYALVVVHKGKIPNRVVCGRVGQGSSD